jgi:N-ethylmaleimide reductase
MMKEVIPEQSIGARFNPSLHGVFGMEIAEDTIPTFDYIIERLNNEYNLAYIHLSEPFTDVSEIPYAETEIAKRYRKKYDGVLMINSEFDQEKGNQIIEDGYADCVSFGKLYISNPDLVGRFRENVEVADWDKDTFYTQGAEGYLDYDAKTRDAIPTVENQLSN